MIKNNEMKTQRFWFFIFGARLVGVFFSSSFGIFFFFVQNTALQKKKKKKKKKKKHVLLGSTDHDVCDPLRGSGEEQK